MPVTSTLTQTNTNTELFFLSSFRSIFMLDGNHFGSWETEFSIRPRQPNFCMVCSDFRSSLSDLCRATANQKKRKNRTNITMITKSQCATDWETKRTSKLSSRRKKYINTHLHMVECSKKQKICWLCYWYYLFLKYQLR